MKLIHETQAEEKVCVYTETAAADEKISRKNQAKSYFLGCISLRALCA